MYFNSGFHLPSFRDGVFGTDRLCSPETGRLCRGSRRPLDRQSRIEPPLQRPFGPEDSFIISPTCLHHAGELALQGPTPEAETTHSKSPKIPARSTAKPTTVVGPHPEFWFPQCLDPQRFFGHLIPAPLGTAYPNVSGGFWPHYHFELSSQYSRSCPAPSRFYQIRFPGR